MLVWLNNASIDAVNNTSLMYYGGNGSQGDWDYDGFVLTVAHPTAKSYRNQLKFNDVRHGNHIFHRSRVSDEQGWSAFTQII